MKKVFFIVLALLIFSNTINAQEERRHVLKTNDQQYSFSIQYIEMAVEYFGINLILIEFDSVNGIPQTIIDIANNEEKETEQTVVTPISFINFKKSCGFSRLLRSDKEYIIGYLVSNEISQVDARKKLFFDLSFFTEGIVEVN